MRHLAIIALTLFLFSSPLQAEDLSRSVKQWLVKIDEINEHLKADRSKKARNLVQRLLSDMCDRIEGGQGVSQILANATFLRGIAEAGLGNESAAHWDYITAQGLNPEISRVRLDQYGDAGRLLNRWRIDHSIPNALAKEQEKLMGQTPRFGLSPLKKVYSPPPKYPFGKRVACLDGPINVLAVIDENGDAKLPILLTSQSPLLGYAALEALRDWRFKPATHDGKPVPVRFSLSVNFTIPGCR